MRRAWLSLSLDHERGTMSESYVFSKTQDHVSQGKLSSLARYGVREYLTFLDIPVTFNYLQNNDSKLMATIIKRGLNRAYETMPYEYFSPNVRTGVKSSC